MLRVASTCRNRGLPLTVAAPYIQQEEAAFVQAARLACCSNRAGRGGVIAVNQVNRHCWAGGR